MSKHLIYLLFPVVMIFACSSKNNNPKKTDSLIEEGLAIGDRAPDLSYPNPGGEMISLYSLQGKLVLIDFWASWCPPCRKAHPELVQTYKEFKDKRFISGEGFTVYSISCDKTHKDWVKAIEQDELIWKSHVSDLKGWDAEASFTYKISYIPSNLLIDGDGAIVAKELHGPALRNMLDSLSLEQQQH